MKNPLKKEKPIKSEATKITSFFPIVTPSPMGQGGLHLQILGCGDDNIIYNYDSQTTTWRQL